MQIKPLPPLIEFDRKAKLSHDHAQGGYSLAALERLLRDCDEQPVWRDRADMCCAYYDGSQMTGQQEAWYIKNKLEPRVINLIGRVINGVLGQEAKSRRDPRLEPDDDDGADVADVLNVKLKEAQRETMADMAVSNGYAGQVKAGVGWVEVSRVMDPMLYPYRVQDVPRNEMWWDWRAKRIDLQDARWLCRRQWKDLDEVTALMPEHAEVLKQAANNWAQWLTNDDTDELGGQNPFFAADRAFGIHRSQWIDGGRERIRMYEVWYRVPAQVVVMRVGQRWIQVDERNPAHAEALARGLVKLEKRVTMQLRRAIFAGPYRLLDEATTRQRFPYIPFFAFRRDGDCAPYGMIDGMIPAQDEYTDRRMRIQWMLKAQQLIVESDALDPEYNTIEDIAGTMMRPDMVAVLNANRKNTSGKGIEFRNDFALQKEQFDMMQDSARLVQDVPGVYSSMLGNAPAGVTANSAMQTLVEQGLISMGELNDNYAHARRLVYDELVDLIAEDHSDPDMQISIGTGPSKRVVVLNSIDQETRMPVNMVNSAKWNTGLAEVPASPAYMMQMSQILGDMIRAMAGSPQSALLLPAWVESTTMLGGQRRQLADDMRRMSGMPVQGDRVSAEKWQQQQLQAAQQKQQIEQAAAQMQMRGAAAKVKLDDSKANLARAQTLAALMTADGTADEPDEQTAIDEALVEAMGRAQRQPAAEPATA
jgi:hypothetical protein